MVKKNLEELSVKELREIAKPLEIKGRWNMTREKLIEAINEAEKANIKVKSVEKAKDTKDKGKEDDKVKEVIDNKKSTVVKEKKAEKAETPKKEEPVQEEQELPKKSTEQKVKEKMSYVERIEKGTLLAFKVLVNNKDGNKKIEKVKSAKVVKKSSKNRLLLVETKVGKQYKISYDDVLWVRTGNRWPRGIYELLKGSNTDEENKQ